MSESALMLAFVAAVNVPDAALDVLDDAERERYDAMSYDKRRREFLAGRFAIKSLLELATGRPAADHSIGLEESGRPYSDTGLGISIAHSGGLIACAVAESDPVVIDVERPSPKRSTDRIAHRYFTSVERDWLSGEPADSFYRLWVLKEAWLKARGTGIAGGLDSLSCTIDGQRIDARVDGEDAGALLLYEWQGVPVGLATSRLDTTPAVFELAADGRLEAAEARPLARTAAP